MPDSNQPMIETGSGRPRFASNDSFQLEGETAYNPWVRALGVGVVGSALYASHRMMLGTVPGYAPKLFDWAQKFEERTPFHIGRTFAFTERLSSYLTPDELKFSRDMLTNIDGTLNNVGNTFQRQFEAAGVDFNVLDKVTQDSPLVFRGRRNKASAYMQLVGHEGVDFETRFTPAEGRLAGTASRLDQPLRETQFVHSTNPNFFKRSWNDFKVFRKSQQITNASPWRQSEKQIAEDVAAGLPTQDKLFRPFHSRSFGASGIERVKQQAKNLWSRFNVEALEAFERPQRLFAETGIGLKAGTWNKAFHVPFVGEGGMVNQMLSKRVLPVVLGATALGWLDYKLGHPSDKVLDLGLKANVLRADLTDMLPGGRSVTDFYEKVVPGAQFGPLALPAAGAFAGGLWHYSKVLRGKYDTEDARKLASRLFPDVKALRKWSGNAGKEIASLEGIKEAWSTMGIPGKGAVIGLAAMAAFIPGMLGSRKTGGELRDIYSGNEPVPIRGGRWWELGSTPFEGGRIKAWRPHWSILHKSRSEEASLYGSEANKWAHNPVLHPLKWMRDPYYLEKLHYSDRPYPVASPAFSNVPLVGSILAATIGRIVKPSVRMHEDEWDGTDYSLYSTRIEPKGPDALPPPKPVEEFTLGHALRQELNTGEEYTGLFGFITKSIRHAIFPDTNNKGKQVYFQGSRQMDNFSRRYYEKELGAGIGPNLSGQEHFGYTEPFRRFVQRESFEPQANAIRNEAPSWLPGDDYYTNFHQGDPYVKVDQGFARLPGAGYEAIHPELQGVDPEDYPDMNKLAILADVAPYSREYNTYRQKVGAQVEGNTEAEIEYGKILKRVKESRESIIRMKDRHFTAPVDEISGTVADVSPGGVTLNEYPGRRFQFSSVGTSAADMSAAILGENNQMTRSEVATEVDRRRGELQGYLASVFKQGADVRLVIPRGAAESAEQIRAVVLADDENVNRELIDQGYGQYREDLGGAEARAMHGALGIQMGRLAEGLAFQEDSSAFNPMRYIPSPGHTKLWQERTPLAQYLNNEVAGTRMRRWERPIHDFLMPYARGIVNRTTGNTIMAGDVQKRLDLNSLADIMVYLRDLNGQVTGSYTRKGQGKRTSVGANLMASPIFVASTLPARESHYYREFLNETDPGKREKILESVSPEMHRALETQWAVQKAHIAQAEGRDPGPIGENGRLYTEEGLDEYKKANTELDYGNWLRSKEIADFFSRTGFALPDEGSEAYGEALDYQDVELKIIQQEGRDAHDFNLFDDRAAELWRKPYVDGAVRELTRSDDRTPEQLRQSIEQLMIAARDRNPDVRTSMHVGQGNHANIRVHVDVDQTEAMLTDLRRNPEKYD